jgi:NAD(P)-dependent dehydrogenase (short-subunit alcohol dehydrogenase family)
MELPLWLGKKHFPIRGKYAKMILQSGYGIVKKATLSLAGAGAKVVVFADICESKAKASSLESRQFASNNFYETTAFKMNVQNDQSVQSMVDFVVKKYGRLDYAVNAVGLCPL